MQINAIGSCFLFGILIAYYQYSLTTAGPPFAMPEKFSMRAGLDVFSLYPFSWNRLPWFASVPPLLFVAIIYALKKKTITTKYIGIGALFFILSMGPHFTADIPNPIYLIFQNLPALWRFAKPESMFFVTYIVILSTIIHIRLPKKGLILVSFLVFIQWIFCVRLQPEYPQFSQYIESTLPKNWERRVFDGSKNLKGTNRHKP